jgi:hypothetical protein
MFKHASIAGIASVLRLKVLQDVTLGAGGTGDLLLIRAVVPICIKR